jgi:dTMP kinase
MTVLIAAIGVDGAGKSTQLHRLERRLTTNGHRVLTTRGPDVFAIRKRFAELARQVGQEDHRAFLSLEVGHLIAACYEFADLCEIQEAMAVPDAIVLADRYTHCIRAVGQVLGVSDAWVYEEVFRDAPVPAMTLFFDVDSVVAERRVLLRGIDETEARHIAAFSEAYRGLPEYPTFVRIDAGQAPEQVADAVWSALQQAGLTG